MKTTNPFTAVRAFITISVIILSACGPTAPAQVGGGPSKVQASPMEFTGTIEAINGSEWTVNGQTLIVAPEAVAGAAFTVGDSVHVSGTVAADGKVTVTSIGLPATALQGVSVESGDIATPDPSATVEPASSDEPTGSAAATGVVDSVSSSEITVGGTSYAIDGSTEIKDNIAVGDTVKVHYVTNAAGTLTATEIELAGDGDVTVGGECDDANDNSVDDSNDNTADDNDNADDSNENSADDCDSDDDDDNSNVDDNANDDDVDDDTDDDNSNDDDDADDDNENDDNSNDDNGNDD